MLCDYVIWNVHVVVIFPRVHHPTCPLGPSPIPLELMADGASDSAIPLTGRSAGSSMSTNASGPEFVGDGLRAPRGRRRLEGALAGVPTCSCMCRRLRARDLGPRNRHTVRCRCPFCGHRSSDGGQGCHRRIDGLLSDGSLWICRDCGAHCLALLIVEEQIAAHGHR